MKLTIAHLYPREMNIYGDMGNIITLVKRLEWRGHSAKVIPVEVGQPFDFEQADLIFGGGGQDSGQMVVGEDLLARGDAVRRLASQGVPMLVICGLYQLFGRGFTTIEGQEIPGIGVFGGHTIGGKVRMIGNIVVDSPYGRLVGFENHSGQTILESGEAPLGRVKKGYGNDPKSRQEGSVRWNVIGTYMHGPLLPKNPHLADHLLLTALRRRDPQAELAPINDNLELLAARIAASRPQ